MRHWHLDLTAEERKAIICHMGTHAEDTMAEYSTTNDDVASESELIRIIHEADSRASKMYKFRKSHEEFSTRLFKGQTWRI